MCMSWLKPSQYGTIFVYWRRGSELVLCLHLQTTHMYPKLLRFSFSTLMYMYAECSPHIVRFASCNM